MKMSNQLKQIKEIGFVPLIVLEESQDAVPLAKALQKGGIPVAEVTFRTNAALACIEKVTEEIPEMLVGAGTVHTAEQAKDAVAAGASFIVTPGFQPEVVRWCLENQIDVIPGTVSPSDVEQALGFGLEVCKFFPAGAYGGAETLKALAGPYAGISFMPTGGVSEGNMLEYLSLPNVAAVGGSFLCPDSLVKAKDWDGIASLCRRLVQKLLGFELAHVGINTLDAAEAKLVAERLGFLFGKEVTEFPGAYFSGNIAEVVKGSYLGTMGHIGINTRDIERAIAYFERLGVELDYTTESRDRQGRLGAIYFKEQIGGFAVHLRQA